MKRQLARRPVVLLLSAVFFFSTVPTTFASIVVRDIDMTVPEFPTETDWEGLSFFVSGNAVARSTPDMPDVGDFLLFAKLPTSQAGLQSDGVDFGDSKVGFGYSRVEVGDTVGPGDGFTLNRPLMGAFPSDWEPGDIGYLGVEFQLDLDEEPATVDPHYGWLYLEILGDSSVRIDSYAFETQPGIAIEVPETGTVLSGLLGLATLAAIVPIRLRRGP